MTQHTHSGPPVHDRLGSIARGHRSGADGGDEDGQTYGPEEKATPKRGLVEWHPANGRN